MKNEMYRGGHGEVLESSLRVSPDVMTDEEFQKFDERQERFLMEVSELFPPDEEDEKLKRFASEHIGARFWKGFRQFCAAGKSALNKGEPLWRLQHDHRLGNTNTCAERLLLAAAHRDKQVLDSITVYRGENVHVEDGKLLSRQATGDKKEEHNQSTQKKPVMRHMVTPCAYCREGLCRHNPNCMVIMPPGILPKAEKDNTNKTTIKLPAFMLYPQEELFQKDDPLEQRLLSQGQESQKLLEARKKQKEFFKQLAKEHPLTDGDRELLKRSFESLGEKPETKKPFVLIGGRTKTDRVVEFSGEIPMPPDPEDLSYVDYPRNEVEVLFVDEVLEEPPVHSVDEQSPKPSHSLNVFVELYREPGSKAVKLQLPNADTRQRILDRFRNSFILVNLDGEVVKLPTAAFVPNRYKRVDKQAKNGRV
jgi:hypothetical protein